MRRPARSLVLAIAAGVGAAGSEPACVIAPPGNLPPAIILPPQILSADASPPDDEALTEWGVAGTGVFLFSVQVVDPAATTIQVQAFVDGIQTGQTQTVSVVADGPTPVSVSLDPGTYDIDVTSCHNLRVTVLDPNPQAGPSDISWTYSGGNWPYGCQPPDASAPQDASPLQSSLDGFSLGPQPEAGDEP